MLHFIKTYHEREEKNRMIEIEIENTKKMNSQIDVENLKKYEKCMKEHKNDRICNILPHENNNNNNKNHKNNNTTNDNKNHMKNMIYLFNSPR